MPLIVDKSKLAHKDRPVADAVGYLAPFMGMAEVTEKNVEEWIFRFACLDLLDCKFIQAAPNVLRNPTPDEVRRCIGLTTNVDKQETRAAWMKRMPMSILADEAMKVVTRSRPAQAS